MSLALRHGYPMLVGGAVRVGRGFRFRMVVGPRITLERTGDRELDLRNAVEAVNRGLERMLTAYPEQYLWIHDRYRDGDTASSPQPAVGPS